MKVHWLIFCEIIYLWKNSKIRFGIYIRSDFYNFSYLQIYLFQMLMKRIIGPLQFFTKRRSILFFIRLENEKNL